jgi:hypothetical protein
MLVNKETGKISAPGSGDGFLESFVEGFDANSGTQELDKSSQPNAQGAPTIQDDDYFINQ